MNPAEELFRFIIYILAIIVIIYFFRYKIRKRKEMGVLTGRYYHLKTHAGFIIKVEYKERGFQGFRKATNKEIRILKKYKYLKS